MVMTIDRASDGNGFKTPRGEDLTVAVIRGRIGGNPTQKEIADRMQADLQAEIDLRVRRSTLPDDEETKSIDPAQPHIFWDGADLVTRNNIVGVSPEGDGYRLSIRVA